MRRNACNCLPPAGSQPCTATLIAWRLGAESDPAVVEPVGQAALWMRLWGSTKVQERTSIAAAWRSAHLVVLFVGVKWSTVSGPMQATIATLGQLGWAPCSPHQWLAPGRDAYADLNDKSENAQVLILDQVRESAQKAVWKTAAKHYLGGGLEEGAPS